VEFDPFGGFQLKAFLATATPTPEQQKDIDFLLILGELFTCVVYGQLILENAKITNVDRDLLDQIFDFMVRDFSKYALQLCCRVSNLKVQRDYFNAMAVIMRQRLAGSDST
jgi:acyl-CoA dehydrogenase